MAVALAMREAGGRAAPICSTACRRRPAGAARADLDALIADRLSFTGAAADQVAGSCPGREVTAPTRRRRLHPVDPVGQLAEAQRDEYVTQPRERRAHWSTKTTVAERQPRA